MATPAAVPKRENKLKAFFRSRSRSRSRAEHHHPTSDQMPSALDPSQSPPPNHTHTRHTLRDSLDNPPSSFAKSSLRSQNRPVSSTTTATHSTITPLPSDALKIRMNRGRYAYVSPSHSADTHTSLHDQCIDSCEYESDDHRFPRSETPSSSTRKLPLPSFFGISLARKPSSTASTPRRTTSPSERKGSVSTSASDPAKSSRKRSFRLASRPATPKSVDESSTSKSSYSIPVPSNPLPLSASPRRRSFGLGGSQRSTPKSSTGHLPLPHALNAQAARSHGRRHSVGSERPPHDSAVALPEEPSHPRIHKDSFLLPDGGRNKGKERETPERPLPGLRPSINNFLLSSTADPSSLSQKHPPFAGQHAFPDLYTVDSASSDENKQSSLLAPHHLPPAIPQIIHTPPTPQRLGEVDSLIRPSTSISGVESETAKIKTAVVAHREEVLVSSYQSHSDVRQPAPSKGRFTPRFFSGKDSLKTKDSNRQKSNKTPAKYSDGPTYKTPGSNVVIPTRNMTSHRSKLGSFDFERPVSAVNRSGSTLDHVSRDNASYIKPRLHSLERTISQDSVRSGKPRSIPHQYGQVESPLLSQLKQNHSGDASLLSFSSVSLQTRSTAKGTGNTTPAGQSSSWGRASGRHILRTSHGTFAFEQPSSTPGSPDPQTFKLPNGLNRDDFPGHVSSLDQSDQSASPFHDILSTATKHSRGQSHTATDYVESGSTKPSEHKSKGKGRSLDLGLGLSWAPSRLREEVLMPGLILSRERAKREKSKANGSDVTNVFQGLLSETRFQTFKKYVHRFDAHIIPLEGPCGLLARVEKLLAESGLSERDKNSLMSEFAAFVENHGG